MELEPIKRMTRDISNAGKALTADEARYLVDYYYICQEDRKRANNQTRALGESEEPNLVVGWLADQAATLEGQVKRALDKYTDTHLVGSWLKSVHGIGPVIAAGLLAHIDITKAPTVGHIWRYAGLDPTQRWERGQKRPWNASLKVLCWKAGQSFMKFSNQDECYYGKVYRERKAYEVARNERGDNAAAAAAALERVGKDTDAYAWLSGSFVPEQVRALREADNINQQTMAKIRGAAGSGTPMLPPAQIDARARRYAVKLFLSHLHEVWYERHFGERPPLPYPIAILGHAHKIPPLAGSTQ
jgi:hypothetical protein